MINYISRRKFKNSDEGPCYSGHMTDIREILHPKMDRLRQHKLSKNSTKTSISHSNLKLRIKKSHYSVMCNTQC
ncbi:hypothetical protein ACET3Z_012762 [Daucus carota]